MNKNSLFRLAGWSAILSAIATLAGAVTLVIFFSVGDPYGKINDISSIVIAATGIVVLVALHKLHSTISKRLSFAAIIIGVIALLTAGVVQTIFVLGFIRLEQTSSAPYAFSVFGVSIATYGCLAWFAKILPRGLAILGVTAGLGYALVGLGFVLGGPNHMLTYIGGALSVIAYPVWGFWLGRIWLQNAKG
ncbi:MAG: hypothetical protein ACOYZ8_10030 [Chloroflexota bacterium]